MDGCVCAAVEAAEYAACGLQRGEFCQAGGRRACADQLYRRDDDVPRIWSRAAWNVLGRDVSVYCGDRCAAGFRGVPIAVQRALGELSGGLQPLREAL